MILFGDKAIALLDLWSIEHFCAGCNSALAVTALIKKYFQNLDRKSRLAFQVMFLLLFEFFWEIIEHYLEAGVSYQSVTDWFAGVEYIWNRALMDPIVTLLGLVFITRFPQAKIFSIIFSFAWLYVNIFVFSDSMGLNRMVVDLMHNF